MKDADAAFLYRWILYIVAGAAVFSAASAVLGEIEADKALYLMSYSLGGAYIVIALIVMIWQSRQRIAEAILRRTQRPVRADRGSLRALLALPGERLRALHGRLLGRGCPSGGQRSRLSN